MVCDVQHRAKILNSVNRAPRMPGFENSSDGLGDDGHVFWRARLHVEYLYLRISSQIPQPLERHQHRFPLNFGQPEARNAFDEDANDLEPQFAQSNAFSDYVFAG